jgi:predicted  nucleic acid-binding Zn-ribbon protein
MSNHLGDTNKMVSETPRMDASAYDDGAIWETGCDIERELKAANERIKGLEKELNDNGLVLQKIQHERDGSNDRIKRLEELGKELRECASMIGTHYSNQMETIDQAEAAVEAWDKFNKETKQ